jgi:hypothetical protein
MRSEAQQHAYEQHAQLNRGQAPTPEATLQWCAHASAEVPARASVAQPHAVSQRVQSKSADEAAPWGAARVITR